MRKRFDASLYLVTDRALSAGRSLEAIAAAAAKGGAGIVQLREKTCSTREYVALALSLKEALKPYNTLLIINDRVDVALAANADGVHLGNSDMSYEAARRILGKKAIIGLSVESIEDAHRAEALDADYLGISPVYATPTKTDTAPPIGIDGLKAIAAFSKHILVAIGGINRTNAIEIIRAGAHGLAVVSAICSAPDPETTARELRSIIDTART